MRLERKYLLIFLVLIPLAFVFLSEAGAASEFLTRSLQDERAELAAGNAEGELNALEDVLQFQRWRGDLWQRAGRLYMDSGDPENALKAFEAAQELGQLDAQGQVWLADMLITNGYGDAAKHVMRSIETSDIFIILQGAALLVPLNDHEGLVNLLQKGYTAEPDSSEVNYQLGIHTMTLDPGSALAHLELARKDTLRAIPAAYLIRVIQQYGELEETPEWSLYAGQALAQAGEWNAAFHSFTMAVEAMPKNATALALLAETQQQLGMDGWPNLEKARTFDPDGEMVNGMLGLYYRRQGNLEKSLEHLGSAHQANPKAAVWLIESGRTFAAMGELEKALSEFNAAIEIDLENIDSWQSLAEFSIQHNYQVGSTGLKAARQALALDAGNPVMMDLLGTVYMQVGDLDSAERFFQQALAGDPEQAAILIHLGQLSLYRGDQESAFDYLRRAAASARDDRLRDMANRLLKENGAQ